MMPMLLSSMLVLSAGEFSSTVTMQSVHNATSTLLDVLYESLPQAYTTFEDLANHKDCIKTSNGKDGGGAVPFSGELSRELFNKRAYGSCVTYGEMLADDMFEISNEVIESLSINDNTGEVWDIGSGAGKVTLQMFMERNFPTAIGIELVTRRWDISVSALRELKRLIESEPHSVTTKFILSRFGADHVVESSLPGLKSHCLGSDIRKICFVNGDATTNITSLSEAQFVYTCSQCFPPAVLEAVTEKFGTMAPGAAVVSVAKLPENVMPRAELNFAKTISKHIYRYHLPNNEYQDMFIYQHSGGKKRGKEATVEKEAAQVHIYSAF